MPKQYLGIEISSQGIKLAQVETRKRYVFVSYLGEFFWPALSYQNKDTDVLAGALKKFLKENQLKSRQVILSICSNEVILQQMSLLKIPDSEVEGVVIGELEKKAGSSQTQYLYTYNYYPLENQREKIRVFYLGIETLLLDFHLEVLGKAGLLIEAVDFFPLSCLNYLYSLAELKAREIGLVLVKKDLTSLLIFKNSSIEFFYTVNLGLDNILKDAYTSSEVSARTLPAGPDLVIKGFSEEIKRIFKAYEAEYKTTIQDLFLIWDNKKAPHLDQKLSGYLEKGISCPALSLPISLSEQLDFSLDFFPLTSSLLRLINLKHEFNLSRIWNKKQTKRYLRKYILSCLIYLLIAGFVYMVGFFYLSQKKSETISEKNKYSQQVVSLEKDLEKLKQRKEIFLNLKQEIRAQADFINRLNRICWSEVTNEIFKVFPKDVWVGSFELRDDRKITLAGKSLSLESLAKLLKALYESDLLKDVKFTALKEEIEGQVSFNLEMRLK